MPFRAVAVRLGRIDLELLVDAGVLQDHLPPERVVLVAARVELVDVDAVLRAGVGELDLDGDRPRVGILLVEQDRPDRALRVVLQRPLLAVPAVLLEEVLVLLVLAPLLRLAEAEHHDIAENAPRLDQAVDAVALAHVDVDARLLVGLEGEGEHHHRKDGDDPEGHHEDAAALHFRLPPDGFSFAFAPGGDAPSSDCSWTGMRTMRTIGAREVCERKLASGFSMKNVSSTL